MPTKKQSKKFDSVWNALMFNIYTGKPDSIVLPFLKNHFPYLTQQPEPGGWTMYPPGKPRIPQRGIHVLQVDKHPAINTAHKNAKVEFLTNEWKEGPPGIVHSRVEIFFDRKIDADLAYKNLLAKFRNIEASIEQSTYPYHKKAIIKKSSEDALWDSLSVFLRKKTKGKGHSMTILFDDDMGDAWV